MSALRYAGRVFTTDNYRNDGKFTILHKFYISFLNFSIQRFDLKYLNLYNSTCTAKNGMKREVTAKAENFRGQESDNRATNGGELHAFY